MGLEQRENWVENTINKQEELHLQNEKNTQKINIAISKRYQLDGQSDVVDLAQKIESDRKVVDWEFYAAFNTVHMECKADLSSLKFDLLNDKFWGNAEVKSLYYELKNELWIDLFQTLKAYDDYICKYLVYPEDANISVQEHQMLIKNLQTIIVMEISKLNEKLIDFREKNNGSLRGMQWIINSTIAESLEPVKNSVMASAQFFLEMQDQEMQDVLKDKIWSLHVNMRMRQIKEALIDKELIIHHKDGVLDFHKDNEFSREIDEIPNDIIKNDSFWTANKTRNAYRDLALTNKDINADGSSIQKDLSSLDHVSVLNEFDQQTEIDYMISWIALELLLALPLVGTANSLLNSITSEDINVELIKNLRPDLNQDYRVETTWWDRVLEIAAAWLGIVGLRSLAKSWKIAEVCQVLAKTQGVNGVMKSANILQSEIFKTMAKMWGKLWINLDKIEQFFQAEQLVAKEKNIYDRSTPQIKTQDNLKEIFESWINISKNDSLDIQNIIKISQLNDLERWKALKQHFPYLDGVQIQNVIQAHHMPGDLFSHSQWEIISKMRFLINDAKIAPEVVKKIMDMWFAGKISEITQLYKFDTSEFLKNLRNFPDIKHVDFAVVQNKQVLTGGLSYQSDFQRDIMVEWKKFMTIYAKDKYTLDMVASSIKVTKKEQLDFMELYDRHIKGNNFVKNIYSYPSLYQQSNLIKWM